MFILGSVIRKSQVLAGAPQGDTIEAIVGSGRWNLLDERRQDLIPEKYLRRFIFRWSSLEPARNRLTMVSIIGSS